MERCNVARKMFVVSAVGILASAFGEEPASQKAAKELNGVEQALQTVTDKIEPKPEMTFENRGTSLILNYQTQKFTIHGRTKSGKILEETLDAIRNAIKKLEE